MRIALFSVDGGTPRLGVVEEGVCVDLSELGVDVGTFRELWESWETARPLIADGLTRAPRGVKLAEVTWLPSIDPASTLWAAAANYPEHLAEGGFTKPDYPPFFLRNLDSVVGHEGSVVKPWFSDRLDYEGELAIVIGKAARFVSEADALDYVAGYSCFNDGSVRDWQRHTSQITVGKNFFASGALGPWVTTADELPDIDSRVLRTVVNGKTVQASEVGKAIWGIRYVVSYLSAATELQPGDTIALGTPGGVGARQTPPLFLNRGDRVEISIDGIGSLAHGVHEPAAPAEPWPAGVK